MKTLALAVAAATGLFLTSTDSAEAGGCGYGGFYGGYGRYSQPFYGHIHHNVNPWTATRGGGHLHWHDTTHYDYVPPSLVRHRNHFHYQPGGYILHRDGHWDLHH